MVEFHYSFPITIPSHNKCAYCCNRTGRRVYDSAISSRCSCLGGTWKYFEEFSPESLTRQTVENKVDGLIKEITYYEECKKWTTSVNELIIVIILFNIENIKSI